MLKGCIIFDNRPTFEEQFLNCEFGYENMTVFGNSKAYTDHLIKKKKILFQEYKYLNELWNRILCNIVAWSLFCLISFM